MRVAISLPVHEKPEILRDLGENLKIFFPEAILIVHVSKTSTAPFSKFEEAVKNLDNIAFNPNRIATKWGDMLGPHFKNFQFALNQFDDISAFSFASSTDMFIRRGTADYVEEHKIAFDRNAVVTRNNESPIVQECFSDPSFAAMMKELSIETAVYSQIEGSIYPAPLMEQILEVVERHFDVSTCSAKYFREEFVFSTIANTIISPDTIVASPYTLRSMFAYNWARGFGAKNRILRFPSRIFAKIMALYYPEFWTLGNLKTCLANNFSNLDRYAHVNGIQKFNPNSIFSIKRVKPDLNNPIRTFLRQE